MIDATELQEQYHLDPFDHDGFVVSVKRNLVEAEATALHPDGEFICRAVRRHRSLAKMGYWLAASAVIALGLIGMIAGLSQTSPAVQGLVTLITVVYLIVVITLAVRFAPHSAVVLLLDESERADALPALVLKRSSRLSVAGDVSALMAEGEGEIGRVRRFGANSSSYSLFLSDAPGVSAVRSGAQGGYRRGARFGVQPLWLPRRLGCVRTAGGLVENPASEEAGPSRFSREAEVGARRLCS
ncbi:hypothetical protein ABWH91_14385 [Phycisphaerales bacterium ac7]